MVRRLTVVVGLAISLVVAREASADSIGPDAFISPTLIDFESAPDGRIDGRYSGLGVTFSELFGGGFADVGTGSGVTGVATNFPVFVGCPAAGCPDANARFSSLNTRVGFYVFTNPADDLTIFAYRGTSLVGSEFFRTSGAGYGGSSRESNSPADSIESYLTPQASRTALSSSTTFDSRVARHRLRNPLL